MFLVVVVVASTEVDNLQTNRVVGLLLTALQTNRVVGLLLTASQTNRVVGLLLTTFANQSCCWSAPRCVFKLCFQSLVKVSPIDKFAVVVVVVLVRVDQRRLPSTPPTSLSSSSWFVSTRVV